jgi:N-glycosylase/DNA lyase
MSICGVGPKVASCALLFGFHKLEFFPIDVWIKRVLAKYYPDGIDISSLGAYAGVAQQYLFYYERYMGGEE